MASSIHCPRCRARLRPSGPGPAGRKLRCPACAASFSPGPGAGEEQAPRELDIEDALPARSGSRAPLIIAGVGILALGLGAAAGLTVWGLLSAGSPPPQAAQSAGLTQARLGQIVQQALDEKSVEVAAPYVNDSGPYIVVFLGWVRRAEPGNGLFAPSRVRKPLEFPIDLQIRTEMIRKAFAGDLRRWQPYLEPYLDQLDKIVARELTLISGHPAGGQDLLRQLGVCDREAEAVFHQAEDDLVLRSRKTRPPLRGPASGLPKQATLQFTTRPDGASVYLITVVDFEAARELGLHEELGTWTELPSREAVVPCGYYYFRARWPDRKSKTTERMYINKDQREVVLALDN
jgi:hypothetical protein